MDLILQVEDSKLWNPGKRKIMGITNLPTGFREELLKQFTKYMAGVYANELVRAIDEQRYGDVWSPLSPQYKRLKERTGWSENTWEATSKLKKSIDWWRSKSPNGYIIGVSPKPFYVTTSGEHIPVRLVALWMEYGTGEQAEGGKGTEGHPGMPPRPLFRPLRDHLSKHIDTYYQKFIHEYEEDIDELLANSILAELSSRGGKV